MGREIDTKMIINDWECELKERIEALSVVPKLNIVRVGDRSDSELYVNTKKNKGAKLGIDVFTFEIGTKINQQDLNTLMSNMKNPTILQLPLPDGLDHKEALTYLSPYLDVDGLTIYQKGLLVDGDPRAMIPATVKGVMRLLEFVRVVKGCKVAIVSRSELIGRPLAEMILQNDGIPVILHSKTPISTLFSELKNADIVITGCGQRSIFDHRNFRVAGQVIIDCSMKQVDGIKGVGDVNKEDVLEHGHNIIASGYGHTGPATVMGLMDNVVKYYEMCEKNV